MRGISGRSALPGVLLCVQLVSACTPDRTVIPMPPLLQGSQEPTPKASESLSTPEPRWSPIATVAPSAHARPYTSDMIATRMAAETTIVLPPPLRDQRIATVLANLIWSYDGRPYAKLIISGSCADDSLHCHIDAKGLPPFAPDRDQADYYWFDVDLRTGIFGPGDHQLFGLPP